MGWISEFREFALKGNVLDLAVGVIIGGAFGKVVASLTNDILLPPLGKLLGQTDFSGVTIWVFRVGNFINALLDFIIVAFAIFVVVKAFNHAKARFEKAKPPAPPAGPTKEEQLLTEIRDLLARR